jgi:hypothetical protein
MDEGYLQPLVRGKAHSQALVASRASLSSGPRPEREARSPSGVLSTLPCLTVLPLSSTTAR